ncbi:aldolase catalytic domain-containing protein [Bacillus sp. AFS017336]|uniref:aldolase catalytic domain-containing protein n=1 Tax=Bacillus sp. AFS017336 TaxID=2033489 RepID=UPI000BF02D72|nr:aldolase catalytic domain-containing protein [Bacillus sp. AFS017336]PEL07018.1 4-hydroxy-2-ketovalerate aldolase [Bacillus sp. AFS017336]
MNNIKLLDCTLRDGGYINNWNFGKRTVEKVIEKLTQSNIDIVECGFLRDVAYDNDTTIFDDVEKIKEVIQPKNRSTTYVAMIDQPFISIDKIKEYDGTSIDGIRLTFHDNAKEITEALEYGKMLIEKGYKVFIQPVGTTSYTDANLLALIEKVNELKPYAFYLVDTLGIMYKNNLLRMYHLLDHNLDKSISIGFHSHNNLQLSFSNAQELLTLHTKRNIIIDSSVFGMGRGAGNLCTELISEYINENIEEKYKIVPLLEIVDEHLSRFFNEPKWGYSVPYFIAAINSCHPNYASYLINKQTISVKSINTILRQIPNQKRDIYDENYIEDLYISHQMQLVDDTENLKIIGKLIGDKKVIIIAPGKSVEKELEIIKKFIHEEDPFIISVNFIPDAFKCDAIFISNSKRFKSMEDVVKERPLTTSLITTSNITNLKVDSSIVVNYSDLLLDNPVISDNAGLMVINLLNRLFIDNVYLAGFDGFSLNKAKNYYSTDLINHIEMVELVKKNEEIKNYLAFVEKNMEIHFVTSTIYKDVQLYSKTY